MFTLKVAQISLWEVQDLGSRNGTFVDGQRILRKEVTPSNKVVLGKTPFDWNQLSSSKRLDSGIKSIEKERQSGSASTITAKIQEISYPQKETVEASPLKHIYEDYMAKRSRIEEIQRSEALNARVQPIGIAIAAFFGASATMVPSEYRYISVVGSILSMVISGWSFLTSRQYAQERKSINMTKLTEQYDISYRCPHCRSKLTDPFPVLEIIKHCRSCKKNIFDHP